MKRYWLYVVVLSGFAALMVAGARQWWWGVLGLGAGLLAGLIGVMIFRQVPQLRQRHRGKVVCVIALGAVIQFAGMELNDALLWALGFLVMLTIPLSGIFHDALVRGMLYRDTP